MYELKKNGKVFSSKSVGSSPRLMIKEFTGPRSHKGWETLVCTVCGSYPVASAHRLQKFIFLTITIFITTFFCFIHFL